MAYMTRKAQFLKQHSDVLTELISAHIQNHPQAQINWQTEDTHDILIALSNTRAFYDQEDFKALDSDVTLIEQSPKWFEIQIKTLAQSFSLTSDRSEIFPSLKLSKEQNRVVSSSSLENELRSEKRSGYYH